MLLHDELVVSLGSRNVRGNDGFRHQNLVNSAPARRDGGIWRSWSAAGMRSVGERGPALGV